MPDATAEAEDTEQTEEPAEQDVEQSQDEPTDQAPDETTDDTDVDSDADGLLDDASDPDNSSVPTDSLPDHMVTDDGDIDTDEVYKSVDGMVDELDDVNDIPSEAFNGDGELDPEGLVEVRNDLRKKMSQSDEDTEDESDEDDDTDSDVPESPDDYELDLGDGDEEIQVNEQAMDIAKEAGHDAELTEDQLQEFVKNYESKIAEQQQANIEEEYKKIADDTDEAKRIVNETNDWLEGLHQQGFLSDEELNAAREMGKSAEHINVFRRMKQMTKEEPIPTDTGSATGESKADLEAQLDDIMNTEGYYEPGHPKHESLNNKAQKISEKISNMEQS